jgi:hypothetical protein
MAQLVVSIGASKAGTTTLFELMRQHPAVAVTSSKETNFFFDTAQYNRGYAWFLQTYFPDAATRRVLFEADNAYMCSRTSLERIKACDPATRIVLMLRNPAERAFSQWTYHVQLGRSRESFADAVALEPQRITGGDAAVNRWGYVERGRYGKYIAQLLEIFPREQVRCILFEHLMRDQLGEFARLTAWLGLPPATIAPTHENPTGRARSTLIARIVYDEKLRHVRRALARPFGGGALKRSVLAYIERYNVVPYDRENRPHLAPHLRQSILRELEPDMALAERLTGLDLSIWRVPRVAAA